MNVEGLYLILIKSSRQEISQSSNRGIQYVYNNYKRKLRNEYVLSYSRKNNTWDNVYIESFHALIKREWISKYYFKNIKSLRHAVFEYLRLI